MAFKSARQRKKVMAMLELMRRGYNRNIYNQKNNVYFGINSDVGPYAGVNIRPNRQLRINLRANMRYGPSANLDVNLAKRTQTQASLMPTGIDINITKKIKDNKIKIGLDSRKGPYLEASNGKLGFRLTERLRKLRELRVSST